MGKLDDLFRQEWEKNKKPSSPSPLRPVPGSVVHKSTQTDQRLSAPARELGKRLSSCEQTWQRTMEGLSGLEDIYEWAEENQPGTLSRISTLEEKCRIAARAGDSAEFNTLRSTYLNIIGQLCEVYAMGKSNLDSFEIIALRLNMRQLRFVLSTSKQEYPEDGKIPFFIRDIPLLLTSTPREIADLVKVKDVIPGASLAVG